ncbi:MAG: hypothetical protein H7Y61_04260 [Rhizobiales bacterium]|nr:hypothetical protein [Rhizobacter sp.]
MTSTSFSIDALPEGGTLADPVHDANGHVLLAAGTVLTVATIASLRRRDVQSLTLVTAQTCPCPDPAALREQTRLRMEVLFRHTLREGLVNPLLHMLPRYRAGDCS